MRDDPLIQLLIVIAPLSLLAIGGASAIYAPLQQQTVDVYRWISAREYLELFAIARVTPGPGSMLTTLIGWKVAGLPGAFVALGAICFPAAVIAWWVAELWERFKDSPWRKAIQRAIAPIVVGMILSSGVVLATPGTPDWRLWLIAALAAIGMLATKLNPLWFLAAGGGLGALLL